jgi:SRSO17 transposase
MVDQARKNEVRFGWVGVDSLYGHNNQFLNALEDRGEHFMADVRKDFVIWDACPAVAVPKKRPQQRGKAPTRSSLDKSKNTAQKSKVEDLVAAHFEQHHQVLSYRQGSKGKLCARV